MCITTRAAPWAHIELPRLGVVIRVEADSPLRGYVEIRDAEGESTLLQGG